jgi:hypothetical protein
MQIKGGEQRAKKWVNQLQKNIWNMNFNTVRMVEDTPLLVLYPKFFYIMRNKHATVKLVLGGMPIIEGHS